MHGQAAEQVVGILRPDRIRNDHSGQQRDHAGGNHGEHANDIGRDLQVLQFRRFDFAIDLSQRFKAAHRQQRMSERDDDRDSGNL